MSKKKPLHLTSGEMTLMDILWDAERPLSRPEIMELAVDDDGEPVIALSSFHLLVNNLLDKGYLVVVGDSSGKEKKHYRRFAPTVTRNEHYALQITSSANYDPRDIPSIVCSLFKYSGIADPEQIIRDIEKMSKGKR